MEFCPGIYEHAASFLEASPSRVSRSESLLAEAHRAAWEFYGQRLVVVGIDIYNIEPESLGAEVGEPPGNSVPALTRHPYSEFSELIGLPGFSASAGRIPIILSAASRLSAQCPGAEVRVPVCGPMAFAAGLIGMENALMGLVEDIDLARTGLETLVRWQAGYLQAIRDAGARPIVFESGTTPPLLPVNLFQEVEAPLLKDLFDQADVLFGERPPCIIGGDAAPIAEALFAARPGYVIAPSETDQRAFMRAAALHPAIHVRVNLPATLLKADDFAPLETAAREAVGIARLRENTSVGCGVAPYESPRECLRRLRDFVNSDCTISG